MLQRWKKNSKKGFTLVELIVVLVILAILAALLIPALTGYIDKAKEKQIIAETRQVVMAAQTLVDELYGTIDLSSVSSTSITVEDTVSDATKQIGKTDVATLAEIKADNIKSVKIAVKPTVNPTAGTNNATVSFGSTNDMPGIVTYVRYERDGKTCIYTKTDKTESGTYVIYSGSVSGDES